MVGHSRQWELQKQRYRGMETPQCARPWDVRGHREGSSIGSAPLIISFVVEEAHIALGSHWLYTALFILS